MSEIILEEKKEFSRSIKWIENLVVKHLLFYLLFLFLLNFSFAQKTKDSLFLQKEFFSTEVSYQAIDSLKSKSFSDLISIIFSPEKDLNLRTYCGIIFLERAKRIKNDKRIAQGYYNLSYLSYKNKVPYEIKYLDSAIDLTKNKNIRNYPSFPYYIKGLTLFDRRDFKNSLDIFLEALKYAEKDNNQLRIYDIKHSIATLKSRIGNNKEALEIFRECYKFYEENSNQNDNKENFIVTLQAISDSYRRNKKIDSSSFVNQLGLQKCEDYNLNDYKGYFVLSEGINLFLKEQYYNSIAKIDSSIKFLKKNEDKPNLGFAYFYLGKNYQKLNSIDRTLFFFNRVDSLFMETNDLHPDLRESYEFMIDFYKTNQDKDGQLEYINRLLKVDSILMSNYKYISKNLVTKFDTPKLLERKEKLIDNVKEQKQKLGFTVVLLIIFLFLILIFSSFLYYKNRTYIHRLNEVLKKSQINSEEKTGSIENNELDIPKEIIDKVLLELEKFEREKGFIRDDITISILAKDLGTNTKYLSKIINSYKGKSFINYINGLRIVFVLEKLKHDRKYRNYSIKAISESVGFKNSQSFSQAFHKNTDMHPSYFIKSLN